MLSWAATFLIIALVAAALGFAGIAGSAAWIAQVLFVVFLVLFLVYVTFSELNALFGDGELFRILFTRRSSMLKLTRRQRIRTLVSASRLLDAHPIDELRDPGNSAHRQLVALIGEMARAQR